MSESFSTDAPTVVFMHIGKTGGATFRRILRRNFDRSSVLSLTLEPKGRHGFLSTRPIEDFAALPKRERERPRLIMAHMMFGIHEFVPRPTTYVTLLRNPVAYVISAYNWALNRPSHRFHDMLVSKSMDLESYMQTGLAIEMDNSQARAIAGDVATPYGSCTKDMLQRAKTNIDEHFSIVGMTECFDETLVMLHHLFGWSKLRYVPANISRHKIPKSAIPARTLALIEEQNWVDIELYQYAAQRFEQQVARNPAFERDLARFRRGNSRYRPWGVLSYTFPVWVRAKVSSRRILSTKGS